MPDQCILWAQQYLTEEPKDAYYREVNSKGLISTWEDYKRFFLDLIENPMNHQISTTQNYKDGAQGKKAIHQLDVKVAIQQQDEWESTHTLIDSGAGVNCIS